MRQGNEIYRDILRETLGSPLLLHSLPRGIIEWERLVVPSSRPSFSVFSPGQLESTLPHENIKMAQSSDTISEVASTPALLVDGTEACPTLAEKATEQPQLPLQEENADILSQNNGRKKAASTILDEAVEVDLGQWLQENPCLYNKGLKDYKNKALKDRL